jgi:hypothetical protein
MAARDLNGKDYLYFLAMCLACMFHASVESVTQLEESFLICVPQLEVGVLLSGIALSVILAIDVVSLCSFFWVKGEGPTQQMTRQKRLS